MPEPVVNYVDHVLDKNGTSYELHDTDCRTIANSKSVVKNQTETASYATLVVDDTLVEATTFGKMTIKNTAARCIYYQGDGTTAAITDAAAFHDAISKAYSAGTGAKNTVGFQVRYTIPQGNDMLMPATHMFTGTGNSNGVIQFVLPAVDGSSAVLVVDTYTMGNASDGSADTHTITTQAIGGGGSVGYISLRGDITNTSTATFTVRNAAETHAIVKEIYDNFSSGNFSAIKNNMVRSYTDYKAGVGTTSHVGVYDLEVADKGVNNLTIAFKFSLPSDAATALLNCIFYVTCKITIGAADDGSADSYTFTTFKVSGTAM